MSINASVSSLLQVTPRLVSCPTETPCCKKCVCQTHFSGERKWHGTAIRRAETTYPHGLGTRMFWGTRATNFSIYTTKMEGAGPQMLGIGAKFKRVPCQKGCSVNRALMLLGKRSSAYYHQSDKEINFPKKYTVENSRSQIENSSRQHYL